MWSSPPNVRASKKLRGISMIGQHFQGTDVRATVVVAAGRRALHSSRSAPGAVGGVAGDGTHLSGCLTDEGQRLTAERHWSRPSPSCSASTGRAAGHRLIRSNSATTVGWHSPCWANLGSRTHPKRSTAGVGLRNAHDLQRKAHALSGWARTIKLVRSQRLDGSLYGDVARARRVSLPLPLRKPVPCPDRLSPERFHLRLRMQRAAWSLSSSHDRVTGIALAAGFECRRLLPRFRRIYGVSPMAFRRLGADPWANFSRLTYAAAKPLSIAGGNHAGSREIPSMIYAGVRSVGPYNTVGSAFERIVGWAASAASMRPETRSSASPGTIPPRCRPTSFATMRRSPSTVL